MGEVILFPLSQEKGKKQNPLPNLQAPISTVPINGAAYRVMASSNDDRDHVWVVSDCVSFAEAESKAEDTVQLHRRAYPHLCVTIYAELGDPVAWMSAPKNNLPYVP